MKKMNLKFFGFGSKIVLPLFLLAGLFMLSATSVNAQYVSTDEAGPIVKEHIAKLPTRTASLRVVGQTPTQQMQDEDTNSLRHMYGHSILKQLTAGSSVAEAIDNTYAIADGRVPEDALNLVKQEYIDLLTIQ